MIIFKVKHIPSGLYWKGGGIPTYQGYGLKYLEPDSLLAKTLKLKFSKHGKTWPTIGYVHSAVNPLVNDKYMGAILKDCVIEQYEVNLVKTFPV